MGPWLGVGSVQKSSYWVGLLQGAVCRFGLVPEGAQLLGEDSGCPALVPEAACGPGPAAGSGLGAVSVQKSSHWVGVILVPGVD